MQIKEFDGLTIISGNKSHNHFREQYGQNY